MSVASLRRPTDVLARLAGKIVAETDPRLRQYYAEKARLVAVGFYQRAAARK